MSPRRPRPRGEVTLRRRRHDGAWVVEIRYAGSSIREEIGTRTHQGEALALAAFTAVVRNDALLTELDRQGDVIAAEHDWFSRWRTDDTAEGT